MPKDLFFFFSFWKITSSHSPSSGRKKWADFCTLHVFLIHNYHLERLFSDFQLGQFINNLIFKRKEKQKVCFVQPAAVCEKCLTPTDDPKSFGYKFLLNTSWTILTLNSLALAFMSFSRNFHLYAFLSFSPLSCAPPPRAASVHGHRSSWHGSICCTVERLCALKIHWIDSWL